MGEKREEIEREKREVIEGEEEIMGERERKREFNNKNEHPPTPHQE